MLFLCLCVCDVCVVYGVVLCCDLCELYGVMRICVVCVCDLI